MLLSLYINLVLYILGNSFLSTSNCFVDSLRFLTLKSHHLQIGTVLLFPLQFLKKIFMTDFGCVVLLVACRIFPASFVIFCMDSVVVARCRGVGSVVAHQLSRSAGTEGS